MNTLSTSQRNRKPEATGNTKTAGINFPGIRTISAGIVVLISLMLSINNTYGQTYYTGGDGTTYGINQWIGYVYNNYDWTGYQGYYYENASFSRNWGTGSPGYPGMATDNFRIRYKMQKTFENGLYSFAIQADDAANVSSDGGASANILTDWDCSGVVDATVANVHLNGLTYLVMDYGECYYNASAGITITQTCQMPGPPQNPTGVGTGLTTATLSWNVGSPAGSSTVYSIYVYRASDNVLVQSHYRATSLLTYNLTGLTANTQYYYKIKSEPSCWANWTTEVTSNSFYTGIIPGTPLTPSATATGPTTASLSWAAGSPAGNPSPTYYWVLKNSGGTTVTSGNTTGTSASVTDLTTITTYYFTVYASNNVGSSATATSANIVTLPVAPTSVTATPSTIAVGSSSNLNATSAGNTINWYTAATG
ncbi:MAG: fibronectin type III domain-containing protein, partial [Bacteroidales bacterium]